MIAVKMSVPRNGFRSTAILCFRGQTHGSHYKQIQGYSPTVRHSRIHNPKDTNFPAVCQCPGAVIQQGTQGQKDKDGMKQENEDTLRVFVVDVLRCSFERARCVGGCVAIVEDGKGGEVGEDGEDNAHYRQSCGKGNGSGETNVGGGGSSGGGGSVDGRWGFSGGVNWGGSVHLWRATWIGGQARCVML